MWGLPTAWNTDLTTVCRQIRPAASTGGTSIGGTSTGGTPPAGRSTGGTSSPQAHTPPAYVTTDAPQTNVVPVVTLQASVVEKYELATTVQAPEAPAATTAKPLPAGKSGHRHKIWTEVTHKMLEVTHKISEANDKIDWTEVEKGLEVGVKMVGDLAQIAQIVGPNQPQQC
ncbi:hypothetical protein C8R44DRAFT_865082 [Mycena epipterygia]|nr:hypothetical protein C8R44DRAFT_865082 [Mycena epipterygia]